MRHDYLFVNGDVFAFLEQHKVLVKNKVQRLEADYLLNMNEQELAKALVSEMTLNVPSIREEELHISAHEEIQVDVSGDPRRVRFGSRPFYVTGNKTVIAVPFDGDPEFF
jgi:hypothetical protein